MSKKKELLNALALAGVYILNGFVVLKADAFATAERVEGRELHASMRPRTQQSNLKSIFTRRVVPSAVEIQTEQNFQRGRN